MAKKGGENTLPASPPLLIRRVIYIFYSQKREKRLSVVGKRDLLMIFNDNDQLDARRNSPSKYSVNSLIVYGNIRKIPLNNIVWRRQIKIDVVLDIRLGEFTGMSIWTRNRANTGADSILLNSQLMRQSQ